MPPAPRSVRRALLPAALLAAASACTGPRLQVVVAPKAFPLEVAAPAGRGTAAAATERGPAAPVDPPAPPAPAADEALRRVARARVLVEAPRWQPTPVEGLLIEARTDSVWVQPAAGTAPVGVPRGCVSAMSVWVPGSPVQAASRGAFFGTLIGGAVGLFVNPNPVGWQVGSMAYALPATLTGALVGTAVGWSRPGGRWESLTLSVDAATPPCAPKPVAKPKPKAPVKK